MWYLNTYVEKIYKFICQKGQMSSGPPGPMFYGNNRKLTHLSLCYGSCWLLRKKVEKIECTPINLPKDN